MSEFKDTSCSVCVCTKLVQRPPLGMPLTPSARCWCGHRVEDHTGSPREEKRNEKSCFFKEPEHCTSTSLTGIREDASWYPVIPQGHTSYSWNKVHADHKGPISYLPSNLEEEKKIKKERTQEKTKKEEKIIEKKVEQSDISKLEFKVGKFVEVVKHPNADKLYIEKIEVGEAAPRTIISGLVPFIPAEKLLNSLCVVITNLKPTKLVGVQSNGMVLCGSNAEHTIVELVNPPIGSIIGERVLLQNDSFTDTFPAKEVNARKEKEAWMKCINDLKANSEGIAVYNEIPLVTSAGICRIDNIRNGQLS